MKSKLILLAILSITLLTGCLATKVPIVTTNPDGTTSTKLVYAPSATAEQVQGGITAAAPFLPSPWNIIATGLGGLIAGGLGTYLTVKNQKK